LGRALAEQLNFGERRVLGGPPRPFFSVAKTVTNSSNFCRASADSVELSISMRESVPMVDSLLKELT
jgi:hypothetical protein